MVLSPRIPSSANLLSSEIQKLFDDLVKNANESLQQALDSFQDWIKDIGKISKDNFRVINDGLLVLLDSAVENSVNLSDFVKKAFKTWTKYFSDNVAAVEDLLREIYYRFSSSPETFRLMLEEFVKTLSDFPKQFEQLVIRAAANLSNYRESLEAVLLPLFYGGLLVFGTNKCVGALYVVLKSKSPNLRQRVNWVDMGLSSSGLSVLQMQSLTSDIFALPANIFMIAGLIEALRQVSNFSSILPNGSSVSHPVIQTILEPIVNHIKLSVSDYLNNVEDLLEALVKKMLEDAENDFEIEWLLLQLARFTPVGILFILVATNIKLLSSPAPWLDLLLNPIEGDQNLRVKRLPPPSTESKYIIFSDIHRDAKSDARPTYQFGSIDHFMPNKEMYLELLKHYAAQGYTIIEAGDCEELWFHRDFSAKPEQKLQEIINTHHDIYEVLASLHAEKRYYRVQGNHDSYLRDPNTLAHLSSVMESYEGASPFKIYDFVIIEGVKLMQDVLFHLGLDSDPNEERRPMIVAHGHQWDFWNCDANNILGKLIVSAIVTPLDQLDDTFRDLAGISMNGSPAFNFKQILGDLPVFNNWQSYEPAVQQLDAIQHMQDRERRFTDDVQYSETLASLMGLLIPITPGANDTRGFSCINNRCLFNLMSLGHTHNPHNQPYYDLKVLPYVKDVLNGLQATISEATQGLFNYEPGLFKSNYLNTGMAGWYENCIWAIDLGNESHGTGQPKLINWTHNTKIDRPNHMDWELPHILNNGQSTVGDRADNYLRVLVEIVGSLADEAKEKALKILVNVPVSYIASKVTKSWKPIDLEIDFTKDSRREMIDTFLFQCMLGLLPGQRGSFQATVTIPENLIESLNRVGRVLSTKNQLKGSQLSAAIGMLSVIEEMGRNGIRGSLARATNSDGNRACLGFLLLLTQLREEKSEKLNVFFRLKNNQLFTEVYFTEANIDEQKLIEQERDKIQEVARQLWKADGKPKGEDEYHWNLATKIIKQLPEYNSVPSTDSLSGSQIPSVKRPGLIVKVYLEKIGQPLKGWKVAIEQRTSNGSEEWKTLASANTNQKGEARLLQLQSTDYGLRLPGYRLNQIECNLALYSPNDKEVLRKKFKPNERITSISLPVSFSVLQKVGFFEGRKGRTVDQKIQAICDSWKKRLSNPRDSNAKDDLCLNDLILGAISGLDDPQTPIQNEIVKNITSFVSQESDIAEVAKYAKIARQKLKECLGDSYVECDGSGSLKEIGERLLQENGRFTSLNNLFDNPVPDPEESLGDPKPGLGIPATNIYWEKDCVAKFHNGELSEEQASMMANYYPDGKVLAPPSVNSIEVWDGDFGGGDIVRRTEVNDKILNLRLINYQGENIEVVDKALEMDVEIDSPKCLILKADATGRQIIATDVTPGQKVFLYGSGFVSAKARFQASYWAWEAETNTGRLVPDGNELPANDGLNNLEKYVYGQRSPVDVNATPTTYNGDKIAFTWPDTAGRDGLYRIKIEFDNESEYPTSVEQNEDCDLTISQGSVQTQELYFAVLPPVNLPPVRVVAKDVECVNLTDPEGFLGIPWPDSVLFNAVGIHQRIVLPTNNNEEPPPEIISKVLKQDEYQFWKTGTWAPQDFRIFPENSSFGQLNELEFLFVSFQLTEVETDLDRLIVVGLFLAAVIALTLIIAAIIIAVMLAIATTGGIAVALAAKIIAALAGILTFVLTVAFPGATSLLVPMLISVVDGADAILGGEIQLDGQSLMYRLSPVRFHQVLYQLDSSEIEEIFENEALGGSYKVNIPTETE